MTTPLDTACCACIPRESLALLAELRTERGVQAALTAEQAWVRWEAGNELVLRAILPIHDAVLYGFHDGHWYRVGHHVPAFAFPTDLEYHPLAHVLFPAPVQPIAAAEPCGSSVCLSLRQDDEPRQTTAMLAPLSALQSWSDTVPTARLTLLRGIYLGEQALVIGRDLPLLPDSTRLWGSDVLIPLGYAPELPLPESAVKQAAGAEEDEILLWLPDRAEVIERGLLAPLTRAGLRLASAKATVR